MPLFIQALPFSVSTFWRYLILLPFLAIAAFVLSLASIIPIIGYIVPGTISAGLAMIGLRCALAARGHGNSLDTSKLLTVSMIFCVIGIGVDLALDGLYFALWWGIDQAGIDVDPHKFILGLFVGLLGLSYYWTGVLLALLSPGAIVAAALAVPMTAAAVSATRRGSDPEIFFGLGSGLFSLLIVMAVWLFGGHVFAIFGEIWTTFGLMATAFWAFVQNESIPWELSLNPWTAFASTVLMAWASSWFFATAVLAWERRVGQVKAEQTAVKAANRVSAEDLRALRQRRMQGKR